MSKGILWAIPQKPLGYYRAFPLVPHEHVTLWFDCDRSDVEDYIGVTFTAPIVGIAQNTRIQALKVALPKWVPFKGQVPHITLSLREDVFPTESTQMILNERVSLLSLPVEFSIQFKAFRTSL